MTLAMFHFSKSGILLLTIGLFLTAESCKIFQPSTASKTKDDDSPSESQPIVLEPTVGDGSGDAAGLPGVDPRNADNPNPDTLGGNIPGSIDKVYDFVFTCSADVVWCGRRSVQGEVYFGDPGFVDSIKETRSENGCRSNLEKQVVEACPARCVDRDYRNIHCGIIPQTYRFSSERSL